MTDTVSEDDKAVFQRAVARRNERNIKLKLVRFFVEENQFVGFFEIFDTWVQRYGKVGATDLLIRCISAGEARIQDSLRAKEENKKRKKKRA